MILRDFDESGSRSQLLLDIFNGHAADDVPMPRLADFPNDFAIGIANSARVWPKRSAEIIALSP